MFPTVEERIATVTPSPFEAMELPPLRAHVVRGMEATVDHLRVMLFQESDRYPICKDYLNQQALDEKAGKDADRVNEGWRRKLCEWTFEVVDHFGFDREVVSIALDYLDRTAALTSEKTGKPIAKRDYQLVAVASLYTAIKLHGETDSTDGTRIKLKITSFQELSRGFFKVEAIEKMERHILSTLKWQMNPPVSIQFVAYFLRLLPDWPPQENYHSHETVVSRIYDHAKYLTELSGCVSTFTFKFKPSVVAYACILSSIEALKRTAALPYPVRVQFLKNIAGASNDLIPSFDAVVLASRMLRDICPSVFEHEDEAAAGIGSATSVAPTAISDEISGESGKASPVCVCACEEDALTSRASQAKRVRRDASTDVSSSSSIP